MPTITVFHPKNTHINNGHTEFKGEGLIYSVNDNGELYLLKWETLTQTGQAVFARGEWAYLCFSKEKPTL